jgi:hypothetical protein
MVMVADATRKHTIPYVLCAVFALGFVCAFGLAYWLCDTAQWLGTDDAQIGAFLFVVSALPVAFIIVLGGFLAQVFYWHAKRRLPPLAARSSWYLILCIILSVATGMWGGREELVAYVILFLLPAAELSLADLVLWSYVRSEWIVGSIYD